MVSYSIEISIGWNINNRMQCHLKRLTLSQNIKQGFYKENPIGETWFTGRIHQFSFLYLEESSYMTLTLIPVDGSNSIDIYFLLDGGRLKV